MEPLIFADIQATYPDEWVLLGDPVSENTKVVQGYLLCHHKDKKELTILGRTLVHGYANYRVEYTGKLEPMRRIGIMRRVNLEQQP